MGRGRRRVRTGTAPRSRRRRRCSAGSATPSPEASTPRDRQVARDELHRPDGAVVGGVAVQQTVVGVADQREAVPVERGADDGRRDRAVDADRPAAGVVRLGATDGGERPPPDATGRVVGCGELGGADVGVEHPVGDAVDDRRSHAGQGPSLVERGLRGGDACRRGLLRRRPPIRRGRGRRRGGRTRRRPAGRAGLVPGSTARRSDRGCRRSSGSR